MFSRPETYLPLGAQVSGLLLWAVNVCGSLHSAASFAVLELGVLVLLNSWQPYRPPFQQLWLDPPLCGLSSYFFFVTFLSLYSLPLSGTLETSSNC